MRIYYVFGIPYSSDYLMHYGIKGQKWVVRRFQNPDGTRTEAGKERYGNQSDKDANYFSKELWKKGQVTNSENECEYSAWEYFDAKGSEGNKKAIDDAMNADTSSIKALKESAKDFFFKSKEDIDKYLQYEHEIADKLGLDASRLGTRTVLPLMRVEYPDYKKTMEETAQSRERLIKAINDSVDNGSFDSVFDGYPPVSYKDDGYGKSGNISKTVDGRKAVVASYINEVIGNTPEYKVKGYGFEYLTPYDFEEWRDTKTGKLVKFS